MEPSCQVRGLLRLAAVPARPTGLHQFGGQEFLLSWEEGVTSLTWGGARDWCGARGRKPVSLDSATKAR